MPLQDKGKNIKDFNFYNNADEMEKSVLETACYFSETDDVTVDDVGIGYVGRSNNIIAVNKTDQDVDKAHRSRLYHKRDELVIYIFVSPIFV